MKKRLGLVLALIMCAALIFALGASALAVDEEEAELSDSEPVVLSGEFNYYSTCYGYGEEVHTVVLETEKALVPRTVSPDDFEVYYEALSCGSMRRTDRTVGSVEVDGTTVTLNLVMRGSGTNIGIEPENFHVNIVGDVKDPTGKTYNAADFTAIAQINEELDNMEQGWLDNVQYRLYVPTDDEGAPAKNAPMYVWLHGGGEFGSDNRTQVSCSNLLDWTKDDVQDIFGGSLYVLAIQTQQSPHNPEYLMEAILEVCGNYEIDMNRIYVAGCSMGGYGTNSIIAAYPDFFAAAMPNCPASVITPEEAEALVDLPIIYIHSLNDTTVTPANSITSYNNIKAAGSDKIWCNFFTHNPPNPVTGAEYMGHWSWTWIHNNYTSTEEEFISGEGVFVRNDTEYPYVSTPLSEIGDGYATIAHWLADQKKEVAFDGEFNFYSTCYGYGEEVHTIALETEVELDPATVSPDDFEVFFNAITCGSMRRTDRVVESVEVDGKYVVLNLVMRGSGTNAAIDPENFHVGIVGEVADVEGNVYNAGHFTAVAQINPELDRMVQGWLANVQYRLYVPTDDEGAPAKNAPMYVWLHGGGEFGSDNRVQVSCSNLLDWTKDDVQDIFGGSLYVLAIQTQRSPHNPAYLMEAILEVCNEYDIDMSRIYIAGCSAGGYGTNNTIAAYPNFFAAAMPNCASAITPEAAETLTNLPVMLIHALNDTSVTPLNSITSYNNLKAAGSDKVWINMFTQNPPNPVTGTPYMGHWSWCWIHDNYTSNEEEFVKGEDVFVRDGVEYPYVSTQLSEIGDGYATIAHWLAAQQRENVIYADNVTGEQGDEVIIPVSIAGNTGISSVTVQLNCEQLTVTEVTAGEVLKDTAAFEFNPANGKMIWAGENDITEDGVLFYVKAVIADPTADGAYDIDLEVLGITDANASDVNSSAADAILYVVNPHYPGDVNLDGSIDNRDLIMLARYLVDLVTFNEEQMVLADFNEDGRIDNKDLVLLARYIVSEP